MQFIIRVIRDNGRAMKERMHGQQPILHMNLQQFMEKELTNLINVTKELKIFNA